MLQNSITITVGVGGLFFGRLSLVRWSRSLLTLLWAVTTKMSNLTTTKTLVIFGAWFSSALPLMLSLTDHQRVSCLGVQAVHVASAPCG